MHSAKWLRPFFLAAAFPFALAGLTPGAESREAGFLAELRERELFELAQRHCTDRLLAPELTEIERADLTVELVRTLAAHAQSLPRRDRDALWQEARAAAADFARKWPQHPRLALVTFQDALSPLTRGEQALREYEAGVLKAGQHEPAHAALREAGELLGKLDKELTLATALRRRTPPQADELTAEELELLQQRVQSKLAHASLCRALLFPAGSDDRLAMLAQARERLEQALADPKLDARLGQAMPLDLAECLRWMGRFDDAAGVLGDLEIGADSDTLCLAYAQRIHLAIAQDNPREVLRLLDSEPGAAHLPELDYARLAGRLLVAKAARDPQRQYDQAAAELRRLDESGSTYWALRAGQLLATHLEGVTEVKNIALLARRADGLVLGGQPAEAIAAYDAAAAAAQSTDDERAAFSLGYKAALVELQQGQVPSGSRRLRAVSQDYSQQPDAAAAHLLAARHAADLARTDSKSTDELFEMLREHLATWPNGSTAAEIRLRLGQLAEARGQWQEALDAYASLSGTSPHFTAALARLAALAKEHQDSGPIQAAHAELLLKSEDRDQIAAARDQWQLIARRSPLGSPRRMEAEYSLALSHFKLGDKAAAAAVLRTALTASASGHKSQWEERIKSLLQQCSE
jgi:hypothetical protein